MDNTDSFHHATLGRDAGREGRAGPGVQEMAMPGKKEQDCRDPGANRGRVHRILPLLVYAKSQPSRSQEKEQRRSRRPRQKGWSCSRKKAIRSHDPNNCTKCKRGERLPRFDHASELSETALRTHARSTAEGLGSFTRVAESPDPRGKKAHRAEEARDVEKKKDHPQPKVNRQSWNGDCTHTSCERKGERVNVRLVNAQRGMLPDQPIHDQQEHRPENGSRQSPKPPLVRILVHVPLPQRISLGRAEKGVYFVIKWSSSMAC